MANGEQKSRLSLYILLILVVGLAAIAAALLVPREFAKRQIAARIDAYLGAVGAEDYRAAYALAGSPFVQRQSLEDFTQYARWIRQELGNLLTKPRPEIDVPISFNTFLATACCASRFEKADGLIEFEMIKEDGKWLIAQAEYSSYILAPLLSCPVCEARQTELRRFCASCGASLMPEELVTEPAPSPVPSVDPAILARYAVITYDEDLPKVLYQDKDFAVVDRRLKAAFDACSTEDGSYRYSCICSGIARPHDGQSPEDMAATLDAWAAEMPTSHFPWLIKGRLLLAVAWQTRGDGWPNTVTGERLLLFNKQAREAQTCLEKAHELNPKDAEVCANIITLIKGLGPDRATMEHWYERALAACPFHLNARIAKLEYLMPKWYGEWADVNEFADRCVTESADYPLVGLIKAYASAEKQYRAKYYKVLKWEEVASQIDAIYTKAAATYPELAVLPLEHAYFSYMDDNYTLASQQFDLVGDRWTDNYFWSDLETYHRFRAVCFASESFRVEPAKALEIGKAVVAMAPNECYTRFAYATALRKTGAYDEAIQECREAVALNNEYILVYLELAWLCGKTGNFLESVHCAERALALCPDEEQKKSALNYLNGGLMYLGNRGGIRGKPAVPMT